MIVINMRIYYHFAKAKLEPIALNSFKDAIEGCSCAARDAVKKKQAVFK